MVWRLGLLQGSFRGVLFEVDSHSHDVGRRGQLHEYPQRDEPWFEDLGRRTREFTVEVFLVGDAYALQRDALLAACELPGAGTLVHPYLGTRQVVCTGCRVSENVSEGRMCRFSLTFVEAGAQQFPVSITNFSSNIGNLAGLSEQAAIADFVQGYNGGGLPGFVFDSVSVSALTLAATLAGFSDDADYLDSVGSYQNDLPSLMRQPETFASRTVGLVQDSRSVNMANNRDYAGASYANTNLRGLSAYSNASQVSAINQTTATRVTQAGNLSAFASLVRQAALASEARTIPAMQFDSYDAASSYRADYVSRVDGEMLMTGSENAYLPLSNMAAAVSTDLSSRAGSLPQIRRITRNDNVPSLVLANDLYGDAKRSTDIVARNGVRNPSFIPSGVPLEVLNR